MAHKYLTELTRKYPAIMIQQVDVLLQPVKCWEDGIRMIPAIRINDNVLSGLYLTRASVEKFVSEHFNKR